MPRGTDSEATEPHRRAGVAYSRSSSGSVLAMTLRPVQGVVLFVLLMGGCGTDEPMPDPASPDAGCALGSLECACGSNGSCALDPETGQLLDCVAGVCLVPTCPPGSPGCSCARDGSCADGASCLTGLCVLDDCAPGTQSCDCAVGESCDPGLFCQEGVLCADLMGHEGGPCFDNGSCNFGNLCDVGRNLCAHCDLGTEGCGCNDVGGCAEGLSCSAGLCVDAVLLPPEEPACYTPCRRDLPDGADTRVCSADGLLDGCIGDQTCTRGSCVAPGESPPTCASDVDCPFFQTCLSGGCFSNCAVNADCPTGLGCHLRVCRVACSQGTGTSACDEGQSCDSSDGATGFCIPNSAPDRAPTSPPSEPTFEIEGAGTFELSNLRTSAQLRIRSHGAGTQRVTLRKVAHRLYDSDGAVEQVASPVDPRTGAPLPCEGAATDCPLWWIEMASGATRTRGDTLEVLVPGDCDEDCPIIALTGAGGSPGVRYDGRFEVSGPGGQHSVEIQYVEEVAGRWVGQIHYFAAFDDDGLDAWRGREDLSDTEGVRNALIQRWGAFRRGNLEGYQELEAVLASTRTGSWELGRTQELCDAVTGGTDGAVCYPYDAPAGVRIYVENQTASPVPSATTALPLALHIRPQLDAPTILTGRIDSAHALQYPGNPAIGLRLAANPSRPGACDPSIASDCVVFVRELTADVAVGGRYVSDTGSCVRGYAPFTVPWLVPGLTDGARVSGGLYERTECRDTELPFMGDGSAALNIDLAGANPAPDGEPRVRHIELLDGALINQRDLFLLIRETFPSFVPSAEDASAYGFVVLRRTPQDLEDDDFIGTPAEPVVRNPPDTSTSCDPAVLLALPAAVRDDPSALVRALVEGSAADPAAFGLVPIPIGDVPDQIHYFCDLTGEIDGGGEFASGTIETHLPHFCPGGAGVRYFYTANNFSQADIWAEPCQSTGACGATLDSWVREGLVVDEPAAYECIDAARVFCNDDPDDLRQGKRFYRRSGGPSEAPIVPLQDQIAQAFRYRVQFQSSFDPDSEVGFAPLICDGSLTPYCYEPDQIDDVRERMDCLISIYRDQIDELDATARGTLDRFLREQFSETPDMDGFERLYAELLITLGDEELTLAFASRFDLAGVSTRTFEGSRFERGGLDLTGVAGAEMQRLYTSIQYYQLALDRLYAMGPSIAAALRRGSTNSPTVFISPETVSLYLTRLVRASAQKSLAWSEVGRRYLEFQQTDIARRILERAYAQTYLESIFFAQLMNDISEGSSASFRAQITREIEQAQRGYRLAMLDMEDVFDDVVGERTFFGFPAEYVPFPALDTSTTAFGNNGFEALISVARQRLLLAKEREETAIASLTGGRVDSAQFQAELVRVRNTHEDRLAELCGTFEGDDGARYPATTKYASLSEETRSLGDPCAFVGNGQIYEQMIEVDLAAHALEASLIRLRNARADIEDERTRVAAQCRINRENLEYEYDMGVETQRLSTDLARTQAGINIATRFLGVIKEGIDGFIACTSTDGIKTAVCAGLAVTSGALGAVAAALEVGSEFNSIAKQEEIALKRLDTARFIGDGCPAMTVDSEARVANLVRTLDEVELESIRSIEALRLEVAQVERAQHEAARLEVRQAEAEQMLVNVEAARNDPNARIYRNESVINADIAFDDAMRAAYRATRMYEYYTSTSYPRLQQLFLIRLAARGRPNLENYLIDLENAFQDFEEEQGLPDARVAILSLRDDILQIPLLDESGAPITQSERIRRMQDALEGSDYLDSNGYITLPFGTHLASLSPLTRNHKIRYIEANVIGSDVGDRLGRIYVRQRGTGLIRTVDDTLDYYVFPERAAVVDVFFNGNRVFPPEVYQNLRLRDRPFAHTMWELVINQRDEEVNRDIDLGSLSDIQLFIHYTDFTAL